MSPRPEQAPHSRSRARRARRAFTLVECALSTLVVATMFAAGMAAAGAAARDRRTQTEMRMSMALARSLMAEVTQQQYADPSPNTIAPWARLNVGDRMNWNHIDDYASLTELGPTDRKGLAVAGATGYKRSVSVAYLAVSSPAGATGGTGGVLGGVIGAVGGAVSSLLDTGSTSATDTGLKKIMVTVTTPSGKVSILTGLRCASGSVDRLSTGFATAATIDLTVSGTGAPVTASGPLLNTPPSP